MARILLSAAGGPVAPSIIRHLQGLGHSVLGMDLEENPAGRFFCDEFMVAPRGDDADAYLPFMLSISDSFDLFLPFIDEELRTLAGAGNRAAPILGKTILPPCETLLLCTDKGEFQKACREKDLPIAPATIKPPAIVKPVHGRGGRGVQLVEEQELLNHYLDRPDFICQRHLGGVEYTVDVLVGDRGEWIFGVARKRLKAKGVSIVGQIHMHPGALDLARRVVAAFDFRGAINLQVMVGTGTGEINLIEVNPRLSGSVIFTVLAGFDILNDMVNGFFGRWAAPPATIRDNLKILRYWNEYVA